MNIALIFAGGVGRRMNTNSRPKQFLEIDGKPIIVYTIEHFENHSEIDYICVVCVKEWMDYTEALIKKFKLKKVRWLVEGGKTALESQYKGLEAISELECSCDNVVLIHDGVRPLINESTITACINTVKLYGSAITVAPAIETIIRQDESNMITETISRSECMLARAPQAFMFSDIFETHKIAMSDAKYDYIDSVSMMLAYNKKIYTVLGPAENIKVTTPIDFYMCKAILEKKNSQDDFNS